MLNTPPQPDISFLRTKRFWSCWAVPGLLLALWVEGMLFSQSIWVGIGKPGAMEPYHLSMQGGTIRLSHRDRGFRSTSRLGDCRLVFADPEFKWNPRLVLLPHVYFDHWFDAELEYETPGWTLTLPLWLPLILWLLIAHLWSRHLRRKQAVLP
jgi:hypothetical protein